MTSRRSTQSVTQRSTRQSELHKARRPRRLVTPKTVDDAVGLSRKEERELRRALYASLHESRRPRTPQLEEENSISEEIPKLRKSTRHIVSPLTYPAGVKDRSQTSSANNFDESSQDSVLSVASSQEIKKKIHAQRKFAQGCSLPSTPGGSPGKKAATSPHSLLNRVPKTEDFLTFLCLRGSRLLPANLDYFNFARDESSMDEGSSRPRTPVPGEAGQSELTRESTPESSSSGSNVNEELVEITTPLSTPFRLLQASRKAARASAGTPETARGIVSLRQGLTRKVVHCGSTPPSQRSKKYLYTPEKTPSPSGSRLMFGDFTPAKKSASVKCLPASFLRFSPSGKLALERNGNSPRLTPYKTPAAPSSSSSPLRTNKIRGNHCQGQGSPQLSSVGRSKRHFETQTPGSSSEEDAPDWCDKVEEDFKAKDRMMTCSVSLTDCRVEHSSSVKVEETHEEDALSSSEGSGRKRKYSDAGWTEIGEIVSKKRKSENPGKKGEKRTTEFSDGVFKVPAVPKAPYTACKEKVYHPHRVWSPTTSADVATRYLDSICEDKVSLCKQESNHLSNRDVIPSARTFHTGQTTGLSSESNHDLKNSGCNSPKVEVRTDGEVYNKQVDQNLCQVDLYFASKRGQPCQKQEKVVELTEKNSEESTVPACRKGDQQEAENRISDSKKLLKKSEQLVKHARELKHSLKKRSNRSVSRKLIKQTFSKISRHSSLLQEWAGGKLKGATIFKMRRVYERMQRNFAKLDAQISDFKKAPLCSQKALPMLCDGCGSLDYEATLESRWLKARSSGGGNEDTESSVEQSGCGAHDFLQCPRRICDVNFLTCVFSRLTVVCGEEEKQAAQTGRSKTKAEQTLPHQPCFLSTLFRKSCEGVKTQESRWIAKSELSTAFFSSLFGKSCEGVKTQESRWIAKSKLSTALDICLAGCSSDIHSVTHQSKDISQNAVRDHKTDKSQDVMIINYAQNSKPTYGGVFVRQSSGLRVSAFAQAARKRVPQQQRTKDQRAVIKGGQPVLRTESSLAETQPASEQKLADVCKDTRKQPESHAAEVSPRQFPHPSSYNVYSSDPSRPQPVAYTCMCGHCRTVKTDSQSKTDNHPSSKTPQSVEKENQTMPATYGVDETDGAWIECVTTSESLRENQNVRKPTRDEGVLQALSDTEASQKLAGDRDEQCEHQNVKIRPVLGAVNNLTSTNTTVQRPSNKDSVGCDGLDVLQTKDFKPNSVQEFALETSASQNGSPESRFHTTMTSQSSSVSVKFMSNKGGVCSHGVDTSSFRDQNRQRSSLGAWVSSGVGSSGLKRAPALYPPPPALLSVPSLSQLQVKQRKRVPTGTFKPVEPDQSRVRREARSSSSSSAVRRVLEGVSKKLRKAQGPETRQRTQKTDKPRDRSREDRARNRHKPQTPPTKTKTNKSRQTPSKKAAQKTNKVPKVKPKRRSSLRLKTLAKILGRKRPNYSLVLSGYADMEEYEEEQKKKAAKSALAKAKAEARARASAKQAMAASKPKQPERMTTRSATVKTDDKDKSSMVKRSLSNTSTSRDADERRTLERERSGSLAMKRSLSNSSTGKDGEEKKADGHRGCGNSLKRSLSGSSVGKKDQPALAMIIETKRLKREGGREGEEGRETGKTGHSGARERKSASPQQTKKVTPKKTTPERPVVASSPEVGLSGLEKVPTFHPTEDEFIDPITYIDSIRDKAEPFGMCRIIPPASWKMESKVNEEIRFTTQIQHLHRLFNRWGPIVEQTRAIVHHLHDIINPQNSSTPQIGGVEVDLPQLYHMIRDLGGLQNIVDKKQWVKVADAMKIPKTAHDRVTRLYDVYCKFVLPYAMLNETEREQMQKDAHMHYELSSAEEDAVLKGKSMTLGTFSRIARNVQSMWFKEQPNAEMVETAYWKVVEECQTHVAVQCAHVNTRTQSTAFPLRRESPYFRHSWNLNNLPDNRNCILKCLGPVSGTTIPTLHVGMLFSTSCWSTDPHRLPYVQYLHSGASTIWYCIPKSQGEKFHEAMRELCPTLIHNDPLWLSEDTAMVNPEALKSKGLRVTRCVQQPRQFVVVFPDVYTATVSCGYNVSESVHYATTEWLSVGLEAAKALWHSGEKELFSVDTLVCGLCQDSTDLDTLHAALPLLHTIVARELEERRQLSLAGLKCERRLAVEDSPGISASLARKRSHDLTEDSACEVCYRICYLSMVLNEHDEQILCLEHGLRHVQRKRHVKAAKLFYRYTEEELTELVQATKDRVAALNTGTNTSTGAKKRMLKKQDSKS